MVRGQVKRLWWIFQKEVDEWGLDGDVMNFIDWLYDRRYNLLNPKTAKEVEKLGIY
jgi:hypothetical protein